MRYKVVFFDNLKRRVAKLKGYPRQKLTTAPLVAQQWRKPPETIASTWYRVAPAWEEIALGLKGKQLHAFSQPRPHPSIYGTQRYAVPNFVAVEYQYKEEPLGVRRGIGQRGFEQRQYYGGIEQRGVTGGLEQFQTR